MQPRFAVARKGATFVLTQTVQQEEEINPRLIDSYIVQETANIADIQRRLEVAQARLTQLKEIKATYEASPDGV